MGRNSRSKTANINNLIQGRRFGENNLMCNGIEPQPFETLIEYRGGKNVITATRKTKWGNSGEAIAEIREDKKLHSKSCTHESSTGLCHWCNSLLREYLYQKKKIKTKETRTKTTKAAGRSRS
jgi:hypothetical protein